MTRRPLGWWRRGRCFRRYERRPLRAYAEERGVRAEYNVGKEKEGMGRAHGCAQGEWEGERLVEELGSGWERRWRAGGEGL